MIYCLVFALFTYLMDWLMCQDPTDKGAIFLFYFYFFKLALKEIDCKQEFH